jgi:Rad/Gem-related GTP binding protein 1
MLCKIACLYYHSQEDVLESEVDAYLVVFSVNDRSTFEMAVETLYQIRHELCSQKAVILVANKIDIVRKRVISSEGMSPREMTQITQPSFAS